MPSSKKRRVLKMQASATQAAPPTPRTHTPRNLMVRRAKTADAKILIQLVAELTAERAELAPNVAPAFTMPEALRDVLGRSAKVLALVAELDGAVVAYAFLMPVYDSTRAAHGLNVTDIYINAEGRKKSVGRTLLAACAAEANRQGKTFLTWISKAWDVPAHDSYRRIGAIEEPVMAHRLPLNKVPAFISEGETMMPARGLRKRRPARR